jgi:hypothetical protein
VQPREDPRRAEVSEPSDLVIDWFDRTLDPF